jgi:peptide/nickel transport system substrate-binding protein
MSDWSVEELAEKYKRGQISRRHFVAKLASAGLGAPVIFAVLQACGGGKKESGKASQAQLATPTPQVEGAAKASPTAAAFQPTKRGGGGTLKVLWWQAPIIANIHLSSGTKDNDASRLFTEPLATFDPDGELSPVLAAEMPSIDKGTVDKDGKWVTWRLKKDVVWHDGKPFTAEDVVFTFDYVNDPATAATSKGSYQNVESVQAVDQNTVKITFKEPTPFWAVAFTGGGHIFPKHLIAPFKGAESRNSPYNLKPVGTGPYKIVDFRPGDVILAEINDKYHVPNRPFFDKLEMKGGGEAVTAARAVLQTGEYDYAWNMQVEADVLASLEKNGIGTVVLTNGSGIEHLQFNQTDPNTEVDGEKGSIKTKHPFFSDLKVRQALTLAINRKLVVDELYGPTGAIGLYFVFNPKKYAPEGKWEFNLQKAGQLLDEAGWKKGSDGIRAKDGKKMRVVYQTSINSVRQKMQAIIKRDLESIGVEVELKTVISDVFFGDPAHVDSLSRFSADLQSYNTSNNIDPQQQFEQFRSTQVAQKENKWSGRNVTRYQNPAYDKLWESARTELDPIKRADLFKKMNQMVIDDAVVVPIVARLGVGAAKKGLKGMTPNAWDSTFWNLPFVYRQT